MPLLTSRQQSFTTFISEAVGMNSFNGQMTSTFAKTHWKTVYKISRKLRVEKERLVWQLRLRSVSCVTKLLDSFPSVAAKSKLSPSSSKHLVQVIQRELHPLVVVRQQVAQVCFGIEVPHVLFPEHIVSNISNFRRHDPQLPLYSRVLTRITTSNHEE